MAPKSEPVLMRDGRGNVRSDQATDGLNDQIDKRPFHPATPLVIKAGSHGD
jgi:hypothetical protein